ncbi:MAG: hypothetical protein Q4F95_15465 [Oscillospiraceae bacterium]|nr:hypothetical protein [Oscillospiraceae bacterium]
MSEFSQQLSYYIKKCSVNISKLSADTGLDRTLLHKYISGKRIPGDIGIIFSICSGLHISAEDTRKLTDSYNLSYFGREIYCQKKKSAMIIDTLNDAQRINISQVQQPSNMSFDCISKVFSGEHAVRAAIRGVLKQTTSEIFILSPIYNSIADDIAVVCADGYSPLITHILPLSAGSIPGHTSYNLSCLLNILPAIIYDNNYTGRYFYSNPEAVSQTAGILPDVIITDNCILRFESDLSCGVLDTSSEIISIYRRLAVKRQESSEIFIKKEPVPHYEKCETGSYIKENVCILNEDKKNILYYSMNNLLFSLLINEPEINELFSPDKISPYQLSLLR